MWSTPPSRRRSTCTLVGSLGRGASKGSITPATVTEAWSTSVIRPLKFSSRPSEVMAAIVDLHGPEMLWCSVMLVPRDLLAAASTLVQLRLRGGDVGRRRALGGELAALRRPSRRQADVSVAARRLVATSALTALGRAALARRDALARAHRGTLASR